jgi:hypothetical protein
MKVNTLILIKKEIRAFQAIVQDISNHWKSDNYATISVLLQNAGFDMTSSKSFDLKQAEKELYDILSILKKISEYKKSHFENWIYSEVNNIINTHVADENTLGYLLNPKQ